LENGYSTIFSEDLKLTEIQIFKILIARAILKNSSVVIIDEPKIPFESPSEKQIFESLKFLCKKKTSVIIAHHIDTLKKADRILVFDKGTIVEDGTHAELLKNDSLYSLLWAARSNGLLPEFLEK